MCINVANYRDALTRGKEYEVLERNDEDDEVKVTGDSGKIRWYPTYCFTKNSEDLATVKTIIFDDKIRNAYLDAVEITLVMSQGDKEIRRWCYFLTPSYIYKLFNDPKDIPQMTGPHGIFIPVLTEETIRNAI